MAGLNIAFHNGKSSLMARQRELAVIAQNLANAGNVNYHRQVVRPQANWPIPVDHGQLGTGVHIDRVLRVYDATLEGNLRQALHQHGYHETYAGQVALLEGTLAPDGSSSLHQAVDAFAQAWSALSLQPESSALRTRVVQMGGQLAAEYNTTYARLSSLRDQIASANGPLAGHAAGINAKAEEIAQLNQQIAHYEQRGWAAQQANDLRDRRDQLVNELSTLTDVVVEEMPDHTYRVEVDGRDLVLGSTVQATLQATSTPASAIVWTDTGVAVHAAGGEIQGLLDAEAYINDTLVRLDTYASELAGALNAVHAGGYDANGAAGGALFDHAGPGQLDFMLSDPRAVAVSGDPAGRGDGANGLALVQALDTPRAGLNGNSLHDHLDLEINRVALEVSSARTMADGADAGVQLFREAIGELSGVNTDEELMHMLEIQRAFQASAKFVTVVDELVGEVINLV